MNDSEDRMIRARARFLGSRLNTRPLEQGEVLGRGPLTVRAGEKGLAILFRFGAVVLVGLDPMEEARFLEGLAGFVVQPARDPEDEAVLISIDPKRPGLVDQEGTLYLKDMALERLQVVAEVLAKSIVLAHYEVRVSSVFDRVEELAVRLGKGGRPTRGARLLREIGSVLQMQAQMVGRVEISEKPEIAWDEPELDRLYERLASEYELRDRDLALSRKLDLVSRTAETYLDLLHTRRGLRLEWYIVILILVEIFLTLYDFFVR